MQQSNPISRRTLLTGAVGIASISALAACANLSGGSEYASADLAKLIAEVEAKRFSTGKTKAFTVAPKLDRIQLSPTLSVRTKTYGGQLPGALIRADYGDLMRITLQNDLDEKTSLHLHGLALRNDMDGVVGLTQGPVMAGASFVHEFKAPHPGTFWYHSHTGLQPEEGMYGPLVIDDPRESLAYDHEWILLLDDWTNGIGPTPQQFLQQLTGDPSAGGVDHTMAPTDSEGMGGMMGGMDHSHRMPSENDGTYGLGLSDVKHPAFIINGRMPESPEVFNDAKPGDRIRLRIINAGSDTMFRFALEGHRLTLTHSDGFPLKPHETDSVILGMGERYDAIVTVGSGAFVAVAIPVGKTGNPGRAFLSTTDGAIAMGDLGYLPAEAKSTDVTQARHLEAADEVALTQQATHQQQVMLAGSMSPYVWTINGTTDMNKSAFTIPNGQTSSVTFMNHSMMSHPMHLHGHTFQVRAIDGRVLPNGPRKDTVLVKPMQSVTVDVLADNPGNWALHCHNVYHMETGMMTAVKYAFN